MTSHKNEYSSHLVSKQVIKDFILDLKPEYRLNIMQRFSVSWFSLFLMTSKNIKSHGT